MNIQINYYQGSKLSIEQEVQIEHTARTMARIQSLLAIAKMRWPLPGLMVKVGATEIYILKNNETVAAIRGDWDA